MTNAHYRTEPNALGKGGITECWWSDIFMGPCTGSPVLVDRIRLEFGEVQAFSREDLPLWEMSVLQRMWGCVSNLEWALLVVGALVKSPGGVAGRLLGLPGQGDQAVDMCMNISTKKFTTSWSLAPCPTGPVAKLLGMPTFPPITVEFLPHLSGPCSISEKPLPRESEGSSRGLSQDPHSCQPQDKTCSQE